jgi:5-methylthioribose kinase
MEYAALTPETLPPRLGEVLRDRLGDPGQWQVAEVGDGNLNLVFIVSGPSGRVIVKQALPYLRLVGESWPLPLKRSFYEYQALVRHSAHDPGRVPQVFHFDETQAMIVMQYLSPHVILRKSVVRGERHPHLADHMGRFMARTIFRASPFALSGAKLRDEMALFSGNTILSDITETLVFTDPYFDAPRNRHTPGLERFVAPLRADRALRIASQEAKHAFVSKTETLMHGDLHSGSLMVTPGDTQVIDPEFAMYGPMGFDVGMFMANLLLAYHAQSGHEDHTGARDPYRGWLLDQLSDVWQVFVAEFRTLWHTERTGLLYEPALFETAGDPAGADAAFYNVINGIWRDALAFCGVEMHRRILGLAHVEDMEAIPDPARRVQAEARALETGRLVATMRNALVPADLGRIAQDTDRKVAP